MKGRLTSCLLLFLLASSPASATTMIRVIAGISSVSCGQGLHTFTGVHRADLMSVDPPHENKTWNISGSLLKCGFLFNYPLGGICQRDGNTNTTKFLYCETQTDYRCDTASIKARTFSNVVSFVETIQSTNSSCLQPHNCEDPALAPEKPWLPRSES